MEVIYEWLPPPESQLLVGLPGPRPASGDRKLGHRVKDHWEWWADRWAARGPRKPERAPRWPHLARLSVSLRSQHVLRQEASGALTGVGQRIYKYKVYPLCGRYSYRHSGEGHQAPFFLPNSFPLIPLGYWMNSTAWVAFLCSTGMWIRCPFTVQAVNMWRFLACAKGAAFTFI